MEGDMANVVNRNLDGPPTQGRSRECQRRVRQRLRQEERAAEIAVGEDENFAHLCEALCELTPEELAQLQALDESQCAYVEDEIAQAEARVEVVEPGVPTGGPGSLVVSSFDLDDMGPRAQAILKAAGQ
jgi:hypothetical protein